MMVDVKDRRAVDDGAEARDMFEDVLKLSTHMQQVAWRARHSFQKRVGIRQKKRKRRRMRLQEQVACNTWDACLHLLRRRWRTFVLSSKQKA